MKIQEVYTMQKYKHIIVIGETPRFGSALIRKYLSSLFKLIF